MRLSVAFSPIELGRKPWSNRVSDCEDDLGRELMGRARKGSFLFMSLPQATAEAQGCCSYHS